MDKKLSTMFNRKLDSTSFCIKIFLSLIAFLSFAQLGVKWHFSKEFPGPYQGIAIVFGLIYLLYLVVNVSGFYFQKRKLLKIINFIDVLPIPLLILMSLIYLCLILFSPTGVEAFSPLYTSFIALSFYFLLAFVLNNTDLLSFKKIFSSPFKMHLDRIIIVLLLVKVFLSLFAFIHLCKFNSEIMFGWRGLIYLSYLLFNGIGYIFFRETKIIRVLNIIDITFILVVAAKGFMGVFNISSGQSLAPERGVF